VGTRKLPGTAALAAVLTAVLVILPAGAASAHEEREIGPYTVDVGFGDEPAYSGVQNSVVMFIHETATDDAVTDLGPTLRVQVGYGDQEMDALTMEPFFEEGEFGTPGDYRAFFFPTRPGDYTFHFTGDIKGTKVDETFKSGPDTFDRVQDPASVEFPAQDPTLGELAEAVQRLQGRLEAAAGAEQKVAALQDDVDAAKSQATLALVVGGILGLIGAVAGIAGLTAARKARRERAPAQAAAKE